MRTIAAVVLVLLAPLTASAHPKPGGTLVFAARQDIDTLDPHITAVQKMGQDFSRKPVGTGPFMVKEWVPKSHVTLA